MQEDKEAKKRLSDNDDRRGTRGTRKNKRRQ